jgi:toxin secretion/phage lysis holin
MTIYYPNPFAQWEIIAMLCVTAFEFISGIAKAQKLNQYDSNTNMQGAKKHVTYAVGACSMIYFALMFNAEFVAIPIFFAFAYPLCVSTIANWALYGVQFPSIVTNFISNEMNNKVNRYKPTEPKEKEQNEIQS